ncbi:hypothetical protein [Streptomyces sp. NPDC002133]
MIPSDGSEPVVMVLAPEAKPAVGPWSVVYGPQVCSPVQPGVEQLELA